MCKGDPRFWESKADLTPLILPPAKNNFQVYLSKAEGLYGGLYTINPEFSTETVALVRLILAGMVIH